MTKKRMKKTKIKRFLDKIARLEAEGKEISRESEILRHKIEENCPKGCNKNCPALKKLDLADKEIAKTRKKLAEARRLLKKKMKEEK